MKDRKKFIVAIDQGTTSSRAILFNTAGVPKFNLNRNLGSIFQITAGLKIGIFKLLKDISKKWKIDNKFRPKIKNTDRLKLLNGWSQAIRKTLFY